MGSVIFTMGSGLKTLPWTAIDSDPKFKALNDKWDDAKARADRLAGKRFLAYFRKRLLAYNTGRHTISICAAMGMCSIDIDGESVEWGNFGGDFVRKRSAVVAELLAIHQALDYDWAWTLDGEVLNVPRGPANFGKR